MVRSAEDHATNFLFGDGVYDGSVKLTCISRLFSNYLFKEYYENSTSTVDYGCI